MEKIIVTLSTLLLLLLTVNVSFASARYPFTSSAKRQRFMQLSRQLRCLVCQNESLAASQAALAIQLRQQVYQMVKNGKTNQQIKAYMVARYGDFVLFKPPVMQSTYLLWFGPFILLLIGVVILIRVVRHNKNTEGSVTA